MSNDTEQPAGPRRDPELRVALKRALRDLGSAARDAGFNIPGSHEILGQLEAAEAELRDRLGNADPNEFRNDERCIQLNRYRTQAYVAFGQLIHETVPIENLPSGLQPYALRVHVLDPKADVVRGLIASPMQQQQKDGTFVLPGHVIQPNRAALWYALAAGIAALAAIVVFVLWSRA